MKHRHFNIILTVLLLSGHVSLGVSRWTHHQRVVELERETAAVLELHASLKHADEENRQKRALQQRQANQVLDEVAANPALMNLIGAYHPGETTFRPWTLPDGGVP